MTLTGLLLDRSFTCRFGVVVVAGQVDSAGHSVCKAPATDSTGAVQVQVKQAGDESTFDYEYYALPGVGRVWPTRGSTSGGTVVSVVGEGLRSGGVRCRFGDAGVVFGDRARHVTSTLVACVAPSAVAEGKVHVDLSLNDGGDYAKTGFDFVYEEAAVVAGLNPSRGLSGSVLAGQSVTIAGHNFARSEDLACRFGLDGVQPAVFTSSTKITCMAPERGEGTVRVGVTNNGVDFVQGHVTFEYARAGHIASTIPSKGPTSGGTRVSVKVDDRLGLESIKATCQFADAETPATEENGAMICVSPRSVAGAGLVKIMLRDADSGTQLTSAASFEYYEDLMIASVTPSIASVGGGGIVTVIGSGMSADGLTCRFGEAQVQVDQTKRPFGKAPGSYSAK